jgi:hypothetical protein
MGRPRIPIRHDGVKSARGQMNIKDMVAAGKVVRFVKARQKHLIYKTESGFLFEVPFGEMDDATFMAEDKAILFLRWIRRAVKQMEESV